MADRWGADLRRWLCSADRFSEAAIFLGSESVKTPFFRSSASLWRVTLPDHLRVLLVLAVFLAVLRAAMPDITIGGCMGCRNWKHPLPVFQRCSWKISKSRPRRLRELPVPQRARPRLWCEIARPTPIALRM